MARAVGERQWPGVWRGRLRPHAHGKKGPLRYLAMWRVGPRAQFPPWKPGHVPLKCALCPDANARAGLVHYCFYRTGNFGCGPAARASIPRRCAGDGGRACHNSKTHRRCSHCHRRAKSNLKQGGAQLKFRMLSRENDNRPNRNKGPL